MADFKFITFSEEQIEDMLFSAAERAVEKYREIEAHKKDAEEEGYRNITIPALCERWNISKGTVHNYVREGLINPIKLGRRVLFPMSEVLRTEANGVTKFRGGK